MMRVTRRSLSFLLLFLIALNPAFAQSDEDLNVVSGWLQYSDIEHSLYRTLSAGAFDLLEERKQIVSDLQEGEDWRIYQLEIREKLLDLVGPFPEKTPLRARTVDTLERPEFTVEKIIYESQPEFYVTAALFLPKTVDEPAPAVIYASGHTSDGFRAEAYQTKIINLVRKGFVVLAFDPVSQGERLQYLSEEDGGSYIGGPTNEHSFAGGQAFLTGSSLARYMIWDGIRSVDYLLTRPEVDAERIGITGRSGGGTQASYIAALDERIYASAPENYITSFKYLLKSIGPQDAEQNFYHGISSGIDHADLLLAHAPKPNLMITTTRDFFSIQGARETYSEVKRAYEDLGRSQHFAMVEDDHGHGSTRLNREAMYAFFQKHLSHDGSPNDLDVEIFTGEELQVTDTGQVLSSLGGETVFSLHARQAEQRVRQLEEKRQDFHSHLSAVSEQVSLLSGYIPPGTYSEPVFTGRFNRDGYSIEKYFIEGEGGYPLPYLLFRPGSGNNKAVLYLDPSGKSAESADGARLDWLVEQGYTVIAPDLPGLGELGPGLPRGDSYIGNISYNILFAGVQTGRSITGLRAGDINRLVHMFLEVEGLDTGSLSVIAKGELSVDAIHAAALNEQINSLLLIEGLDSYQSVVLNEQYDPRWVHSFVPGALQAYDLPDLGALIAPRRLLYINTLDGAGEPAAVQEAWPPAFIRAAFEEKGAPRNFETEQAGSESQVRELVGRWLSEKPLE